MNTPRLRAIRALSALAVLTTLLLGAAAQRTGQLLYVCNQEGASVSIIDMSRNEVLATIDLTALGYPPNAKPHYVAVEPDGSSWYLTMIGAGKVVKFDRNNHVVAQVDFATPGMLALDSTSNRMWVGRSMTAPNPPQRIGLIDRAKMTIDEIEVFYPRPHPVALTANGRYFVTGSLGENELMTVDAESQDVTFTKVAPPYHVLAHFALSPDGKTLVVSGERTGKMLLFDTGALPTLTFKKMIDVKEGPWHPVFTPDGRYVYVGNQRANTITVIDARTWTVAKEITGEGIAEPHGSAVSADGRYVYISNRNLTGEYTEQHPTPGAHSPNGTVVVIDTKTQSVVKVIEVGPGPSGIGTIAPRRP